MQLQNGRPENTDGRLDKEIRVYDVLQIGRASCKERV